MSAVDHASFVYAGNLRRTSRVAFDPANKDHRAAYVKFQRTGRWDISFYANPKYDSIPRTIDALLAEYAMRDEIREFDERALAA